MERAVVVRSARLERDKGESIVFEGRAVAAIKKTAPMVVGDGLDAIRSLPLKLYGGAGSIDKGRRASDTLGGEVGPGDVRGRTTEGGGFP